MELSHFFYGSAKEQPHGDEIKLLQYALYSPMINRFVLTHSNKSTLQTLSVLFSGRYNLILCRLDRADNFHKNLIDNLVALSWTTNPLDINFTRFLDVSTEFNCTQLINDDFVHFDDQEYLMYSAELVELFTNDLQRFGREYIPVFEEILFNELPIPNYKLILKQKVYSIIYNTFSFNEAKEKIQHEFNNYEHKDIAKFNLSIDRLS